MRIARIFFFASYIQFWYNRENSINDDKLTDCDFVHIFALFCAKWQQSLNLKQLKNAKKLKNLKYGRVIAFGRFNVLHMLDYWSQFIDFISRYRTQHTIWNINTSNITPANYLISRFRQILSFAFRFDRVGFFTASVDIISMIQNDFWDRAIECERPVMAGFTVLSIFFKASK